MVNSYNLEAAVGNLPSSIGVFPSRSLSQIYVLTPPPLYAPIPVGFDPHVVDTVMSAASGGLIEKVAHDTGAAFINIHKVHTFMLDS